MRTRRFGFSLGYLPVAIGIKALEHGRAHRVVFSPRNGAVAIGIHVRAVGAGLFTPLLELFAALFTIGADLLKLRCADGSVVVLVQAIEHLFRAREEFVARDVAIVVGVSTRKHAATSVTVAAPSSLTESCAHFFARQLTIMVRIEAREFGTAHGVEFLACDHPVVVGVEPLEHSAAVRAAILMVLRLRQATSPGQRRKTYCRKQNFTHLVLQLSRPRCGQLKPTIATALPLGFSSVRRDCDKVCRWGPRAEIAAGVWGGGRTPAAFRSN